MDKSDLATLIAMYRNVYRDRVEMESDERDL